MGKGIGSGYAPLGAVAASNRILDPIRHGTGSFVHGFTYSGMPASCLVGLQVAEYLQRHHLIEQSARLGSYLHDQLRTLAADVPAIGEVRGVGLLAGIEFVADRETREPFPASARVATRLAATMESYGVLIRPGVSGSNYGNGGDHVQISPPFVITKTQIDDVVDVLRRALRDVLGS
jgi:adenosylmethionine-8-amino-7-oxononanoate aminotransferase